MDLIVSSQLPLPGNSSEAAGKPLRETVDRLTKAPLSKLRAEWARWHPNLPIPEKLPRDLLVRSILWSAQAKEHGGMPADVVRQLKLLADQLATSGDLNLEREARLKPGTRLIREWRGKTYRVEALAEGYIMGGERFDSLSQIARIITGTRWSGPRFFGLKQRPRRSHWERLNVSG